ncbi:MAG: hypothetical protein J0J10_18620 [Bosea sp.]|jgi:hypothetical protein|uniref:hypothetical protein n=1 Tax=Bosea sp. (in: a-proteobacteria) TaxID=1871050 RepID=UPI001ACA55E6|nr:hypothetical protein [Bosea sp. (in: a-proteobacteria)]MBN9470785.1 hypothetical protein [Bosea sp. (in: a-proteobacteria)]
MSAAQPDFVMLREIVATVGSRRVVAVDTIAHLKPEDAGQVVMTGSHGGISSGEYAGKVPIAAVFFNDAGIGKENAGIASLPYLEARGIIAGTVSHDSALIGNALETWQSGLVSALNPLAEKAGFALGEPVGQAVRRIFGGRP